VSWLTLLAMSSLLTLVDANDSHSRIWPKSIPSFRHISTEGISQKQAEYIVALTARHEKIPVNMHNSAIERLTYTDPIVFPPDGFYYFSLEYLVHVSMVISYRNAYYVDRKTGDVLEEEEAMSTPCLRVSFPALAKLQSKIMAATGATFKSEAAQQDTLRCIVEE